MFNCVRDRLRNLASRGKTLYSNYKNIVTGNKERQVQDKINQVRQDIFGTPATNLENTYKVEAMFNDYLKHELNDPLARANRQKWLYRVGTGGAALTSLYGGKKLYDKITDR